MEKVKTLIFITKLPPSPNTNVTFQFYTVQLFLNHLYKNFRSWLMMDELLSSKAPSSHYPLRHSVLMMDLKCFPGVSSAIICAKRSKGLVWCEISRPKPFSDNSFSILGEMQQGSEGGTVSPGPRCWWQRHSTVSVQRCFSSNSSWLCIWRYHHHVLCNRYVQDTCT